MPAAPRSNDACAQHMAISGLCKVMQMMSINYRNGDYHQNSARPLLKNGFESKFLAKFGKQKNQNVP
jgi:hypothetical protein